MFTLCQLIRKDGTNEQQKTKNENFLCAERMTSKPIFQVIIVTNNKKFRFLDSKHRIQF